MLNEAFEALKQYDWGTDRAPVAPIEQAVTASHGNAAAREDLEKRLLAALQGELSRDAKDFVCRMLTICGSAAAVSVVAPLLTDEYHSHMARFVLERIAAPEAGQALRDALPNVSGKLRIGVIGSLGGRRDTAAVPALCALLKDVQTPIARAAAIALGDIGNAESAKALQECQPAAAETKQAVIDAQLACAEALLAESKVSVAMGIYKALAGDNQGRLVRLAATRGMLNCTGKTA